MEREERRELKRRERDRRREERIYKERRGKGSGEK